MIVNDPSLRRRVQHSAFGKLMSRGRRCVCVCPFRTCVCVCVPLREGSIHIYPSAPVDSCPACNNYFAILFHKSGGGGASMSVCESGRELSELVHVCNFSHLTCDINEPIICVAPLRNQPRGRPSVWEAALPGRAGGLQVCL